MRVETRALEGMERINWRCFAPLLLHLRRAAGKGILMSDPESRGLFDITFSFSCYATSKNELFIEYFYAKASGIRILMGICTNLKPWLDPPTFSATFSIFQMLRWSGCVSGSLKLCHEDNPQNLICCLALAASKKPNACSNRQQNTFQSTSCLPYMIFTFGSMRNYSNNTHRLFQRPNFQSIAKAQLLGSWDGRNDHQLLMKNSLKEGGCFLHIRPCCSKRSCFSSTLVLQSRNLRLAPRQPKTFLLQNCGMSQAHCSHCLDYRQVHQTQGDHHLNRMSLCKYPPQSMIF